LLELLAAGGRSVALLGTYPRLLNCPHPFGKVQGMLSINAYTGAVSYHCWHGRLIAIE